MSRRLLGFRTTSTRTSPLHWLGRLGTFGRWSGKGQADAPNIFTKSNVWQDDQDQRLFAIQRVASGARTTLASCTTACRLTALTSSTSRRWTRPSRTPPKGGNAAQLDEDNVFTENNEFEKPVKVAQGGSSSHACTNAQLGTQRVELDNEINNLQGQVDVLDGRVGANEDALGDLGQKNTDQDAQIEENTQKIDALARTAAGGVWRYMNYGDTSKTDDGEFTPGQNQFGQPCRNWDEAKGMTVASKDDGGTDHDISAWQAGDHIELFEEGGTGFAIFELAKNTQTSRPGQQELKPVLRQCRQSVGSGQVPLPDLRCIDRH